jgi:hypothetical protein
MARGTKNCPSQKSLRGTIWFERDYFAMNVPGANGARQRVPKARSPSRGVRGHAPRKILKNEGRRCILAAFRDLIWEYFLIKISYILCVKIIFMKHFHLSLYLHWLEFFMNSINIRENCIFYHMIENIDSTWSLLLLSSCDLETPPGIPVPCVHVIRICALVTSSATYTDYIHPVAIARNKHDRL